MQPSWGVLFDWDGVVIDSSREHEHAWELLAAERGLPLPIDHFKKGFGKKNEAIIPSLGWALEPDRVRELADRKEEIYRRLVASRGVTVLSGARELLEALKSVGIPRAVASSTHRGNLDALFAATGLGSLFDAVVCGDDVTHGKPDPEVFLIEAARRGGMKVVGVATTHQLKELEELGECDLAVGSLLEVSPSILAKLLRTR